MERPNVLFEIGQRDYEVHTYKPFTAEFANIRVGCYFKITPIQKLSRTKYSFTIWMNYCQIISNSTHNIKYHLSSRFSFIIDDDETLFNDKHGWKEILYMNNMLEVIARETISEFEKRTPLKGIFPIPGQEALRSQTFQLLEETYLVNI